MPLIKPEKVLLNEKHIIELTELLLKLKKKIIEKQSGDVRSYMPTDEDVQWAIEQAIMRTSLNDGVDFGDYM